MSDETNPALESLSARAAQTASGNSLDRISVRDYTRKVEIGAFQAERGVTQRVCFNVVLEVSRNGAAATDDVDRVLSYDTITEAIEAELSSTRTNLLETLAERIATRVLVNPGAVRVFVRIEKLDRIPGRLGVEIERRGVSDTKALRPVGRSAAPVADTPHPLVVFLSNDILYSDALGDWLDAIARNPRPAVICLEAVPQAAPGAANASAQRRIALLRIEQNAWVLAGRDKRCVVVDSRTELEWAMKQGQLSVWAPSKIVLDGRDSPQAGEFAPLDLARWFANSFSAEVLVIAGTGFARAGSGERHVARPGDI
ncbi:MAG: dihydroneopterin aldolase [Paracoccaceae bacterium]